MNTIQIVAAVLDTRQLTLYKEDGTTVVLQQGDPRIQRIVDEATPQIIKTGKATIDMTIHESNPYKEIEAKTEKVRFFRIAKETLKSIFGFGSREEENAKVEANAKKEAEAVSMCVGTVPSKKDPNAVIGIAINEIMQHAVPASSPEFNTAGTVAVQGAITDGKGVTPKDKDKEDTAPETIVAVIEDKTGTKAVIPGMEKIKSQFERAAKLGSTKGVENFLARVAKIKRQHTIEDLLKFMERGDLPIADDGSILIYKVLAEKTDSRYPLAKYFDCHSKNVPQWVGARVCMKESLVDPNRNNECSNGLHVARRGYIREFSGDVCVMAKLAPEDVIAVPNYDANKMRVRGYNIIFELPNNLYSLLKANHPITNEENGKELLGRALAGDHPQMTHRVEITAQQGGGIVITEYKKEPVPVPEPETKPEPIPEVKPAPAEALPDKATDAPEPPVDPKAVLEKVASTPAPETPVTVPLPVVEEPATEKALSHGQRIAKLAAIQPMTLETAQAIFAIKKKAKKGWDVLHVDVKIVKQVNKLLNIK